MPICENCKKEINEETTYVYTMEYPVNFHLPLTPRTQ